jgi:hypothetical protein
MRDRFLNAAALPSDSAASPAGADALPSKLIEELSAAREQMRTEQLQGGAEDEPSPAAVEGSISVPAALPAETAPPQFSGRERFRGAVSSAGAALRKHASASLAALRLLSRRMRLRDWERRYLTFLSLLHYYVFDRHIEKLLFIKTPFPASHFAREDGGRKTFVYHGPIPGEVLGWALSALPVDLKRYAFVDFRAGNGRTLLLAARRNFEFAIGYAFDTESCEVLEMNLAQYSRSYMSCRDVRALRGDRDGIAIPSQPAVLFFPDSLTPAHPGIILSHVLESLNVHPRPVYLIFENAGRESGLDQMQFFERVPLPVLNRVKASVFSPSAISVYKSAGSEGTG